MKFTTVIGVLLGLVLLSGDGVESQMTLNFDLPFVKLLLGGEDLIYNILIALRGFSNFRTNAMSSMGGGSGGGGGGSGGGELAASIRGLLDVLVKRGKSGSSNARKGFLDALRFINTVIASVVRTIMRLATNFVIGIGSQKLLDIAKQGRSKLQDQLNKLRPMNILKSLGNGPLRSMLGKIFDGSRLKAFLDFVFTIIKNRMQNNFNDMVNRIKANLRKLPSDLVNKIFEIGD
ncbi:hypothetical protein C0J52_03496 [Blattella germanica]|nr:hypothetical protein C0J52_03496 [Blattella germanica]